MNKYYNLLLISLYLVAPFDLMALPGKPVKNSLNSPSALLCGQTAWVQRNLQATGKGSTEPLALVDCLDNFNRLKKDAGNYVACGPCDACPNLCSPKMIEPPQNTRPLFYIPRYGWDGNELRDKNGDVMFDNVHDTYEWDSEERVIKASCGWLMTTKIECHCTKVEQRDTVITE